VKIISCLPDNFGGKLSEKMQKSAYNENEWESLGICCNYPSGKTQDQSTWLNLIKRTYLAILCGSMFTGKKKRKSILRGICARNVKI